MQAELVSCRLALQNLSISALKVYSQFFGELL